MSAEKPLFIARRPQEFQKSSTRLLVCPKCLDGGSIAGDGRFLDHVKNYHPDLANDAPGGLRWKQFTAEAANKAYVH